MTTNSDLPGFFGETITSVRPCVDNAGLVGLVISTAAGKRLSSINPHIAKCEHVLPGEPWMPLPEYDYRPIRSDKDSACHNASTGPNPRQVIKIRRRLVGILKANEPEELANRIILDDDQIPLILDWEKAFNLLAWYPLDF